MNLAVDLPQAELFNPVARIYGQPMESLPQDLYIPQVEDELQADIVQQLPEPYEQHPAEAAAKIDRNHHQNTGLPRHEAQPDKPPDCPIAPDIERRQQNHEQHHAPARERDGAIL